MTTGGAAYCWGYNLGDGTNTVESNVPVAVHGLGSGVATISTGGYYSSCAVTTGGAAYCWGNNEFGELGDGTNTDSNVPVAVRDPA